MKHAQPAIFLDRDGTLIEEVGYLREPSQLMLLPGAAKAVQSLRNAGFLCFLVTNQSGIARGLFDEADLARIHARLDELLAEHGAALNGTFFSPAAPARIGEPENPDRKPAPGMLLRAAKEHGLALDRSWMIGDRLRDLEAGRRAGCAGNILVRTGYGDAEEAGLAQHDFACDDLLAAAKLIIEYEANPPAGSYTTDNN